MNNFFELIANKPWILIIFGFFLLVSVWIVFFTLAAKNQPVKLLDYQEETRSAVL